MISHEHYFIGPNKIFVEEHSDESYADKPPIILVHGSWGGTWMWSFYTRFLAQRQWNVYAVDLRGHGHSEGTLAGTTMYDYVEDIRAAIVHFDLRTPIIVGYSMGALVALMYAVKYSARAVVSIDGSPSLETMEHGEDIDYPDTYGPIGEGIPANPADVATVFPDIEPRTISLMKEKLGLESGIARHQRKQGISVPKDRVTIPLLFMGCDTTTPLGIPMVSPQDQARYYEADFVKIPGTTHPGILLGQNWAAGAQAIIHWINQQKLN